MSDFTLLTTPHIAASVMTDRGVSTFQNGRPEGEGRAVFRFEGMDEMDPVDGTATATLVGDRLIFVLSYGPGDEYTFECERRL
jgi:hypothetical protein